MAVESLPPERETTWYSGLFCSITHLVELVFFPIPQNADLFIRADLLNVSADNDIAELFVQFDDAKEEIWEFYDENYTSIIPEELRWRNWAVDHKDGKALTGDALLDFVNGKLFPTLKAIAIDENTPMSQIIVRTAFEDNNNYMKDGILLRQVINVIDEIDFEEYEDRHAFGEIYETILRSLQSAGNSGESSLRRQRKRGREAEFPG